MATEATVRPIFQKPGPFINKSTIHYKALSANGNTDTLTIRPPKGQAWVVLHGFGIILSSAGQDAGTRTILRFELVDETNTGIIALTVLNAGSTFTYGALTVTVGSSENGPLLLTNDRYMQVSLQQTSGHASTAQATVQTRVV